MNAELQEQGFFTMAGKVNKQFFLDKTYYDAAKVKEVMKMAVYKDKKGPCVFERKLSVHVLPRRNHSRSVTFAFNR